MNAMNSNDVQKGLNRVLQEMGEYRKYLRPRKGWLRFARLDKGLSAGQLARRMGVCRQLPLQFEKAEANDSITLKSLRSTANALDCDLVYALIPRVKNLQTKNSQTTNSRAANSPKTNAPTAKAPLKPTAVPQEKHSVTEALDLLQKLQKLF
jgi:predicted DNA-binding mobile mystery protein A